MVITGTQIIHLPSRYIKHTFVEFYGSNLGNTHTVLHIPLCPSRNSFILSILLEFDGTSWTCIILQYIVHIMRIGQKL